MQKAFKDIVERLDYLLNHFGEHCEEWGSDKEGDCHRKSCSDCVLKHAIEIVNQVAEEYKQEVCEWVEKSVDSVRLVREPHRLRLFHVEEDRQYCPYCGKKIKVVE